MTTRGKRCQRTRFQPSPQPTRPLAAESPRLDHQWLISNGNHSLRGFGHPLLSLRTWETYAFRRSPMMACRPGRSAGRKENGANGTSSFKGTADSFEAAKAAALFEAEAASRLP